MSHCKVTVENIILLKLVKTRILCDLLLDFEMGSQIGHSWRSLRPCALDLGHSWDAHLHLAGFAYNTNYHSIIQMAPFEVFYGKNCRSLVYWDEVGERKLIDRERVQRDAGLVDYSEKNIDKYQ